jgi:hypothetical protein
MQQNSKEITALLRLIDDPDEDVFGTVAEKLLHYGREIIPNLEQLWEVTLDESVQERIEFLIHRVHFQDLQQELFEWSHSKNPELLRGAILVAKYQFPDSMSLDSKPVRPDKAKHMAGAEQLPDTTGAGQCFQ